MILIADSGSTKTDWLVSDKGAEVQRLVTKGINPCFQSEDDIGRELSSTLIPQLLFTSFEAIHFYGAGCLPEKVDAMREVLQSCISAGSVTVDSDMLGAAHGLCGRSAGIVCILGTGSNSCFYDGTRITATVSPLGFILGDEGSGATLGRLLVGDILKNQLPASLKDKFLKQYDLSPAQIIERVYRQPYPNRFLASLSPFLLENIDESPLRNIVINSFRAFLRRNVMQYDYHSHSINFVGSVAYHYSELLVQAVAEAGMSIGNICKSPMDGIVNYWKTE